MVSVGQPVSVTFHIETVNAPASVETLDVTQVNRNTVASLHSSHLNLIPSNTAPDKEPPIILPTSLTYFDQMKSHPYLRCFLFPLTRQILFIDYASLYHHPFIF